MTTKGVLENMQHPENRSAHHTSTTLIDEIANLRVRVRELSDLGRRYRTILGHVNALVTNNLIDCPVCMCRGGHHQECDWEAII